jgi:hypothetical protein
MIFQDALESEASQSRNSLSVTDSMPDGLIHRVIFRLSILSSRNPLEFEVSFTGTPIGWGKSRAFRGKTIEWATVRYTHLRSQPQLAAVQ